MNKINKATYDLVKKWEGYYDKAYLCPAGVWTIGWGHTSNVKKGDTCTVKQAEKWLQEDLEDSANYVSRYIQVPLNDNQFGALVSACFNIGPKIVNPSSSTLARKLNEGDYDAVPGQLGRWSKAKDPETGKMVTLKGLSNRRKDEGVLWNTPTSDEIEKEEKEPIKVLTPEEPPIATFLKNLIKLFNIKPRNK